MVSSMGETEGIKRSEKLKTDEDRSKIKGKQTNMAADSIETEAWILNAQQTMLEEIFSEKI